MNHDLHRLHRRRSDPDEEIRHIPALARHMDAGATEPRTHLAEPLRKLNSMPFFTTPMASTLAKKRLIEAIQPFRIHEADALDAKFS